PYLHGLGIVIRQLAFPLDHTQHPLSLSADVRVLVLQSRLQLGLRGWSLKRNVDTLEGGLERAVNGSHLCVEREVDGSRQYPTVHSDKFKRIMCQCGIGTLVARQRIGVTRAA